MSSSSSAEKLEIVVGELFPTDAALANLKGVRTLFLRPQTFSSAVRNVRNVLPGITIEAAEKMVREHCPEFRDLDDLLGLTDPVPPSVERPPVSPADDVVKEELPRKRRRKAVLVAAMLPALVASWALGRYTSVVDDTTPAQVTASTPDATPDAGAPQAPFTDPNFDFFSGSSSIVCEPISTLEAECTDADGMVMSTKAATGPDSTIFTFSYGSERIGLRIFYDAAYAQTWARQDASKELYPNMQVHDRYVLWGTDPGRIKEYADLLEEASRQRGPSPTAMGGATPLPPRLAALTLGTLGLNNQDVQQIIARPAAAMSDAPAMFAARLVLGLDPAPPWSGQDGVDIVALAVGIGPRPPSTGGGRPVTEPSKPVASPPTPTPTPTTPETSPSPAEESPAPAEPSPPAEEIPTPGETPAEGATPPGQESTPPVDTADQVEDDLLILESAWTVSAT